MTAASSNRSAGQVGFSSTRPSLQSETYRVTEAGVDTWRLLFRTTLDRQPDKPIFDVGQYKAQWFAGHGVLALEGHPTAGGLAEPWGLEDAYQDVLCELKDWGHVPTRFDGLARLDSTATLRMDRQEGQAVLAGLAALDVPSCQPVVRGKPAHSVGTCTYGVEGFSAVPTTKGERPESLAPGSSSGSKISIWAASGARPGREQFHAEYVRGRFHKRFVPLYRSARGVKVTGLPVIARDVAQRVEAGELDTRQAERMMGSLLLLSAGAPYSRSTYYKRRAELRDNGYVIADDFFAPVEVDLGAVLAAALETPLWGG